MDLVQEYAGWIASVAAGLAGLGWMARRAVRTARRAALIAEKIDRLDALAAYELASNGGNSIKDRVSQIPDIANRVTALEVAFAKHTHPPVVVVPPTQQDRSAS